MAWDNVQAVAEAKPQPIQMIDPAQVIRERDVAIQKWLDAKKAVEAAVLAERNLRDQLSAMLFPNPTKGTQRVPIGQGYNIKLVHGFTYTLGDKDKTDTHGQKVPVVDQVDALYDAICKVGRNGEFVADRLIRWKPELSATEYEKLDEAENGSTIKKLVDGLLTVKPSAPQLTFEEPKA